MNPDEALMTIERSHLKIRPQPRILEVDLTEGVRKDIENLVEAREPLGRPLDSSFKQ